MYCIKNTKLPEFDYLAAYYCLKNGLYNVYSQHTFTKNYGHDGTGLRSDYNEQINHKMDNAIYSNALPYFSNLYETHIISKLPLIHENHFQRIFKIAAIRLNIFDELKLIYKMTQSFINTINKLFKV